MLQCQRQEEILSILEKQKTISIANLAGELYVSEATVRRDIHTLEKAGLVRRVYGGVMLPKYVTATDPPLSLRAQESRPQKEQIAIRAAELLYDGASLFMDASSTVQHMIPYLKPYRDLTVITNSLRVIELLDGTDIRVLCTGGQYISRNRALAGPAAIEMVQHVNADFFFFSSQGISLTGEISDFSGEETALRKQMIFRATRSYFLCDQSKIGLSYLYKLCDSTDIDGILCDGDLPETIRYNP